MEKPPLDSANEKTMSTEPTKLSLRAFAARGILLLVASLVYVAACIYVAGILFGE